MSRIRGAVLKPKWITILVTAVVATVVLVPVVAFALAPHPPTALTAVSGATQPTIARLNWNASTSPDAVRYAISVATSAGGPFKVVGSTETTGYDFKDGLGGVTYYFRVAAVNDLGEQSSPGSAGPVKAAWVSDPHAPATRTTNKCASCHVPHQALASPLMRTEISTDTPGQEAMCLTCHDGKIASAGNVAYGIKDSFALASGHALDTTSSAGGLTNSCASCHDPHGTANVSPMMPQAKINGSTISSNGKDWCLACHDNGNSWYPNPSTYPTASAPIRDAAGYPVSGTWLGKATYNGSANGHRLIPETTRTAGLGQAVRRDLGDCLYCHAAHRGANAYDGLKATFRPTTAATLASDQTWGTYASMCFICHGGLKPSGFATAPVDIKRSATGAGAAAGHRVKTEGGLLPVGSPLPCYECHNPHGSTRGNKSMISDVRGASLTTTDGPVGVRQFCFTCHTTSDTGKGWDSASTTYTVLALGAKVVGIARNGGVLILPASVNAHAQASSGSCYACHGSDYDTPGGTNVHNPGPGDGAAEHAFTSGSDAVANGDAGCTNSGSGCHGSDVTRVSFAVYHPNSGCTNGTCHTSPSKAGYVANGDCQTCHNGSFVGATVREPLVTAHFSETTHTATALTDAITSGGTASGRCIDCHNTAPANGLRGLVAQHTDITQVLGSPYGTTVSCVECHNDTRINGTAEVLASWSTDSCADCHSITSAAPQHSTSTAPSRPAYPTTTCSSSGTSCHSSPDIHSIHKDAAGCNLTGCHDYSVQASAPIGGNTCGTSGTCHTDKADGTHGAAGANAFTTGSDAVAAAHDFTTGSDAVATGDAGCTNSGSGCHGAESTYSSFVAYHPTTGCTAGACHTSPSKATYTGNGDCQSCHYASFVNSPARADLAAQHYNETSHTATGLGATVSSGGSASATCSTCHDPVSGLAGQHTNITAVAGSPYGTTIACVECHADIRANGNAEVLANWTTNACADCHSITSSAPQHAATAPVVTATSAESCGASGTNCHTRYDVHALHKDAAGGCTLTGCHDATKQGAKPTLLTCGSGGACHSAYTGTTHTHAADAVLHALTNTLQASEAFASTACDACHVMAVTDGGLDAEHSLSTSAKTTNAANVCLNCHNNSASTSAITGNWADKDTASACASCHTAALAIHATVDTTKHTAASSAGCAATGVGCHNTDVLSDVGADKSVNIHDTCLRCHDRTAASPNLAFDPAQNSCGSCHASGSYNSATSVHNGTGGTADGTDTMHHTADLAATGYSAVYAGGQACSSCHSAALKTAHTASSAGSVTCAGCHNDTTLGSAAQIKVSWTNDRCTDCHATSSVHTAFETAVGSAATHKATSTAGCAASGVGCHTTDDLGTLHADTPSGCATCHATDKDMSAAGKTCGQATGCHSTGSFHVGISGNDTTHTAPSGMGARVDSASGYSGNACSDCHTSTLKSAHDKAGPTSSLGWTNECADCHNSTTPVNGSAVVTSNWTTRTCAQCHTTSHDSYFTGHIGTPTGTNTCSGCHTNDSLDLRVVHSSAITSGSPTDTGCGISGCHKTADTSLASKSCGTGGACHSDMIDGNHGVATAHSFSAASDYNNTTVAGCTNSGPGCHAADATYSNFADYHLATSCVSGACHTSPSKPTYTGDHECVSCHDGSFANAPVNTPLHAPAGLGHYSETTHTAVGLGTIVTAGGTASASCNDCHNATNLGNSDVRQLYNQHQGLPAPYVDTTCVDCHSDTNVHVTAVVTSKWQTKRCDECHNSVALPMQEQHGTTAPVIVPTSVGTYQSMACDAAGCHAQGDIHAIHKDAATCALSGCHDYNLQAKLPVGASCGGVTSSCHKNGHG